MKMMEMKEQTGSRKKLLVPVVVLMLCLVTLTGAAYAYSSTMTYTSNSVDSDAISIDFKGGSIVTTGDDANYIAASGAVVFEDHFNYTGVPASAVKTNTVKAEVKDMLVITYKLTVSGDALANKVKVSSSTIDTYLGQKIGNDGTNDVHISDLFSVKVSDSADISGISGFTALADDNDVVEFDISKTTAASVDKIIYIYIDTGLAAAKVVNPSTASTAGAAYKVASDFVTAFNAFTFDLTFEATYEE